MKREVTRGPLGIIAMLLFGAGVCAAQSPEKVTIRNDTLDYVILKYVASIGAFDHATADTLSPADLRMAIQLTKKMLAPSVNQLNQSAGAGGGGSISLNPYKVQFFPVKNEKGEKEVWVNCLCKVEGNGWRTSPVLKPASDTGQGSCYINFKISLAKRSMSGF